MPTTPTAGRLPTSGRALAAAGAGDADRELEELWGAFHAGGDAAARAALARHYYPLVTHVARGVAAALRHRVELDDLVGYGAVGLLGALDRFDLARGAQFTTFAAHRIRGAIYDGVRAADWAPRSVRRREREVHENYADLCHELGRQPSEQEEARALGVGIDALRSAKAQAAGSEITSLEAHAARHDGVRPAAEPARSDLDPLSICIVRETTDALRAGVRRLGEREREVTALSFQEGMTLAEIGRRLGVTESRACQIRSDAIRRLRAYAREQGLVPA